MKRTKWLLTTTCGNIPIDEEEIVKILNSLKSGSICMLRQGVFNPSMFGTIRPDDKEMDRFLEDKKHYIAEGMIKEFPAYPDLFASIRPQLGGSDIKKLHG